MLILFGTIVNNQADGGVEVVCMVTGWPKPRLEWRREGVVTTKGSRRAGQR